MRVYKTTAFLSAFLMVAGFASAKTKLTDTDLSDVQTISSNIEVVWDVNDPVVSRKSAQSGDTSRVKKSDYERLQRVLTRDMKDSGIALDNVVGQSFAAVVSSNASLKTKLTDSRDTDAHFKVSVYEWGLYSRSNNEAENVKPVLSLRVELIDDNGQSVWHKYERVTASNTRTPEYSSSQIQDNANRLNSVFNQAVNVAMDRLQNSL